MQFGEVVATSERVAATSSRRAKIETLAGLLRRLETNEVAVAVGFLTGRPWQGRTGVGWASLGGDRPPAAESALTIADVDAAITEVAGISGSGSVAARTHALDELFGRATATEQEFIRRLFIGEVRQGALDGIMTDAVAKAAEVPLATVRRAVMLSGNLGVTASIALSSGAAGLEAIALEVLRPIKPMLASTATDVAAAIADCGLSSVEEKLDGVRVQAHKAGDDVRLYTRSLRDITAQLPGVVELVRSLPAQAIVLDGEMVGLREDDDAPEVFQDTMSRLSVGDVQTRFFDCLHLDGVDLIDAPLTDRLDALERVASQWRVKSIVTDDPDEAAAFMDGALAAGHEGVMVKAAASRYEAGRRGKSWRKIKPVTTFDLVVLGAEWGHGRRRGWLSNLHLGARDPSTGSFVMVGKTFKGLTDALLTWQTEKFLSLKTEERGHVVFIRPEVVVEIALDGVQRSTRYPGGVALRFARVRGYRDDKSPDEADTIDALRAML